MPEQSAQDRKSSMPVEDGDSVPCRLVPACAKDEWRMRRCSLSRALVDPHLACCDYLDRCLKEGCQVLFRPLEGLSIRFFCCLLCLKNTDTHSFIPNYHTVKLNEFGIILENRHIPVFHAL